MRMLPISFQKDALAVEAGDDFQRLLLTFTRELLQQGAPFGFMFEAAQKSWQPLIERRRTKRVPEFFASNQTDGVRLRQNRKWKSKSNLFWKNLCLHQRGG